MSIIKTLHDPILSRRKEQLAKGINNLLPAETISIADIGCGDGEIAALLKKRNPNISFEGWEVHPRERCHIPFNIFDGKSLPHKDKSIDVVMLIDILHHDNQPETILKEATRIARLGVILKDHQCENLFDYARLKLMDWVGNHHYGVRLPYNYLSAKQWKDLIKSCDLEEKERAINLNLYLQPLECTFGSGLHFLSLLTARKKEI